ncbi:hypothetical protein ACFE04_030530 [Oxalis oulophora]
MKSLSIFVGFWSLAGFIVLKFIRVADGNKQVVLIIRISDDEKRIKRSRKLCGNGRGIGNQQGSNGRGSTGIGNQQGSNGRGSRHHTSQPDQGSIGIGNQQGSNGRGSRDHTSQPDRGSTGIGNQQGSKRFF